MKKLKAIKEYWIRGYVGNSSNGYKVLGIPKDRELSVISESRTDFTVQDALTMLLFVIDKMDTDDVNFDGGSRAMEPYFAVIKQKK